MSISKSQMRATAKYKAENYGQITTYMKKDEKEAVKLHAEKMNESVNAFVNRAIAETMKRDLMG